MSEDSQQDARRDERLVNALLLQNPVTYINFAGVPTAEIPFKATPDKRKPTPINGKRMEAELTKLAWEELQILPHVQEIKRLMHLLHGKAWNDERSDEQLIDLFDNDPLFEALSIFMNDPEINGEYLGPWSKLLQNLRAKAEEELLDLNSRLWPANASQLSRRLNDLRLVIQQKLYCCIERDRDPASNRRVRIRRQPPSDDDDNSASIRRQADNVFETKGLASMGDADDQRAIQEKFARVHLKNRRENNGSSS